MKPEPRQNKIARALDVSYIVNVQQLPIKYWNFKGGYIGKKAMLLYVSYCTFLMPSNSITEAQYNILQIREY
jgi:hypothetical protein